MKREKNTMNIRGGMFTHNSLLYICVSVSSPVTEQTHVWDAGRVDHVELRTVVFVVWAQDETAETTTAEWNCWFLVITTGSRNHHTRLHHEKNSTYGEEALSDS